MAMSWLATTVRGDPLPEYASISLASAFLATTRLSATSSGAVASILAWMSPPTLWPALPALWIILATCLGELYCMTRSVDPTSIPSSREDVQTRAFISPDLKASSISIRVSFDRDP